VNTPLARRTKIIATLGPATDRDGVLESMIREGLNVVRINFSHGESADHVRRAERVREISAASQCHIGILGDLQGPKIRIDRFVENQVTLRVGDPFVLDSRLEGNEGNADRVGITYKALPDDVRPGDTLLLDDGRLVLDVDQVARHEIFTRVRVGGVLGNSKGINRLGGGLSAPSLTDKDRKDIELASQMGVDYLAVSFPRSADDIREARLLLRGAGGEGGIIAKIERPEALECIDEIIEASDGIMIARGDLGVEIGDAELPAVQKRLITKARNMNRVAITATQMMETMSINPIPTRAEVFDVANAVLDGTDAVMLSGETAVGKYPVEAIEAMSRICLAAETQRLAKRSDHRIDTRFQRVDEAIAMATMYTANHLGVRAIAALSESGSTPLWMSRISSAIPIYALTGHDRTSRKVTLFRGVYPANIETTKTNHAKVNRDAVDVLKQRGVVQDGDLVIITKGDLMGVDGGTNAMKIVRVGELVDTE
jgi:pyruvate kinase